MGSTEDRNGEEPGNKSLPVCYQHPIKMRGDDIFHSDDEDLLPFECDLCEKIFNTVQAYEQHINGKKHHQMVNKANAKKTLQARHQLKEKATSASALEDEPVDELYCDVCEKTIVGYIPFQAHINGNSHAKKEKQQKMRDRLKNKPGVLDEDLSHDEDDLLQKLFAKCTLCEKVFYDPVAYDRHMKGVNHKKKAHHQKTLEDLKNDQHDEMANGDDGDDLFKRCDICNKAFSGPVPYKIHLKSPVHQKAVKKAEAEKNLKAFYEKEVGTGKLICKECSKVYPDANAFKLHLDDNSHEKNRRKDEVFKLVEDHPEIVAVKSVQNRGSDDDDAENEEIETYQIGRYFLVCQLCHTSFTGLCNAVEHVKSTKHQKKKKERDMKKEFKKKRAEQNNSTSGSTTAPSVVNPETDLDDFELLCN